MSHTANNPRVSYAHLQYFLREKMWRHAQALAGDMFAALNDYTFLAWKAFALDREGAMADALREYKLCESKRGATTIALVGMHLIYQRNKDSEAVAQLEQKLAADEARPNHSAQMQAAALLWHAGESARARDMIIKVLDSEPEYRDEYTSVLTVRAWIDLTASRGGGVIDKCLQYFDKVIQVEAVENLVDIDALLGKVAVLERKNQFWPAQELLNKCLVAHRGFTPAMIMKARQLLRIDDWDQAADIITTVLASEPMCVEALILSTLNLLVKESRVQSASRTIADLIKALQVKEPRNGQLYLGCAQAFSRLAASSLQILTLTTSLAESAAQLMPTSSDAQSEVAYQSILRGDYRTAQGLYKKASTAGDGNVVPLVGLITCAVAQGSLSEAAKQLDFLNEIASGQQKNPELLFLGARLAWLQRRDAKGSVELLDRAVEAHRQEYAAVASGLELYVKLNPHLVMQMASEYVQHCRTEPGESSKPDPLVEKTRRLLDQLLRLVPGCTEAQLLNSRMAYISGDLDRASALVAACLRQDQGLAEAHLLQAAILQHQGNFGGATQALELALSLDFEINEAPTFNLLRGTLLYHKGEFETALAALKLAVKAAGGGVPAPPPLPGAAVPVDALGPAQKAPAPAATNGKAPTRGQLTTAEHVALYLQLAQTQLKLRDVAAAKVTLRDATLLFTGHTADRPRAHRERAARGAAGRRPGLHPAPLDPCQQPALPRRQGPHGAAVPLPPRQPSRLRPLL
jgi:tetratricopeptide repeat protein 21B